MTPPVELVEQSDEFGEVIDPEAGPSTREHEERIGTLDIGPAHWQRAHPHGAGLAEEDPVLSPRMGVPDEVKLLADERVERVGHTESLRTLPTDCS